MNASDGNGGGADDPADPGDIARRFADLWQAQLSAMAADPALARTMAETMQVWQRMAGSFGAAAPGSEAAGQAMQAWMSAMTGGGVTAHDDGTVAEPPGSSTVAGSSDGGERLLHELARRVARLEERLDRLESAAEGGSGKPSKKSGPRKRGGRKPA